jgi:hypothetical protein
MIAPGMTPARAIPMTISGSYSRATLMASARQSSPNISQDSSFGPSSSPLERWTPDRPDL